MECKFPVDLLSAYLDAELDPPRQAAVEEHLRSCAACHQELTALREMDGRLKNAVLEEPSAAFTHALDRRIVDRIRPRPRRRLLDLAPVFASLAAAVVLVIVIVETIPFQRQVGLSDRISFHELPARPERRVSIPAPELGAPAAATGQSMAGRTAAKALAPDQREEELLAGSSEDERVVPTPATAAAREQVVRAIIDSTGTIIKVAAGSTLIPETDTVLEKELTGRQVAPPVIEGKRQRIYSDLSTAVDADMDNE